MLPLSTYSALLTQNNSMINTSMLTTKLSQELSTGKRAIDLADNPDRQTILDLTQTKNDKAGYLKSCTLGLTTTSQYTVSLQHIEKVANLALKAVQDLMSASKGLPSPKNSTDPAEQSMLSQYDNLSLTITQALTDMTISLNEQSSSGGGYLYSGLRNPSGVPTYTLPPVRDLNVLPYFTSASGVTPVRADPTDPTVPPYAAPPTPVPGLLIDPTVEGPAGATNPGLPTYDSDYGKAAPPSPATLPLPSQQTMAWGVQKLTIDSNETIDLNITSTHPAFQNLINGLRAAKTAADQAGYFGPADAAGHLTSAERDGYMSVAFSYLTRAISGGNGTVNNTTTGTSATAWQPGIRDLQQRNSLNELALQTKSDLHTANLNVINTRLDSLVGVDTTTVTVQLATANNQLQASYKVTASLLNMSLMNYLK
ncbi:MAG: hypothetical protein WCO00_11205 [Rhodospirillaceae bacterium]